MILKIFSPKNFAKKLAFLTQNKAKFWKKIDRNIGFWEKRQFFRQKLSKIAENCDHNIDPRLCSNPRTLKSPIPRSEVQREDATQMLKVVKHVAATLAFEFFSSKILRQIFTLTKII
jgi:hypothetical protein